MSYFNINLCPLPFPLYSHLSPQSMASSSASSLQSKLPTILQNFQASLQKIDALERRLEEKVAEKRQRAVNLLDEIPNYRQSTLRLFVTHQCEDETLQVPIPDPNTGQIDPNSGLRKEVKRNKWNLVIEGRLLVGHLDHESAAAVEKRLTELNEQEGKKHVTHSDTLVDTTDMTTRERAQTRFIHDREGEEPLAPIKFTHFFDRISVSFQTFQKRKNRSTQKPPQSIVETSSSTSSRSKRKSTSKAYISSPPPSASKKKKIVYHSNGINTNLFWNRQRPAQPAGNGTTTTPSLSLDTHAFHAIYNEEKEPEEMENTVVATIRLHRRQGQSKYKPSSAFIEAILPFFLPKKSEAPVVDENVVYVNPPPLENDVHIPRLLTIDEAMDAIYLYAKDKSLLDENNLGSVINDSKLESLFECKTMNMGQVKEWLLSKGHLVPVVTGTPGDAPIVLTYIMTKATAEIPKTETLVAQDGKEETSNTDAGAEPASKRHRTSADFPLHDDSDAVLPNLLSCDIDVDVPHLYHIRTRDILRRIKIREYDYTQGRTPALRSVEQSGANEDYVRECMEHVLKGKALTKNHTPILMAMGKMAPEGSEARKAVHIDMKTASLINQVEFHVAKAKKFWELIDSCRNL